MAVFIKEVSEELIPDGEYKLEVNDMATIVVNKYCITCKNGLSDGDEGFYINKVKMTDTSISSSRKMKEDELRIKHMGNSKKYMMCSKCFEKLQNGEFQFQIDMKEFVVR